MIKPSTSYALTDSENAVIAKGSARNMQRLRKQVKRETGNRYTVWNAPSSKIGDTLR